MKTIKKIRFPRGTKIKSKSFKVVLTIEYEANSYWEHTKNSIKNQVEDLITKSIQSNIDNKLFNFYTKTGSGKIKYKKLDDTAHYKYTIKKASKYHKRKESNAG